MTIVLRKAKDEENKKMLATSIFSLIRQCFIPFQRRSTVVERIYKLLSAKAFNFNKYKNFANSLPNDKILDQSNKKHLQTTK